jgi:Putative zinc-finger
MNCLSESALRAYHDGESTPASGAEAEAHLSVCARCREQLKRISETAGRVQRRLDLLDASDSGAPIDPHAALASFRVQHGDDEERAPILQRLLERRWRPAWAVGALGAILLVSLAFPLGRGLAQRILATLRVERVQPVRFDTTSFDEDRPLQRMLSQLISDKVVIITDEKSQKVATLAEASRLAGFHVRVPHGLPGTSQFNVEGQHAFRTTIDRARLQDILDQSGRPDLLLPATIDGETISFQVPRGVRVQYGECAKVISDGENQAGLSPQTFSCTMLVEAPSPIVDVPADLNLQQLAEIGLQLAGMSAVQAREFCQTVDWKSTLVLPITPAVRSYETVTVDGVQGTLMTPAARRGPGSVVIWVKDGIIYCLASPGGSSEAIALADSLD